MKSFPSPSYLANSMVSPAVVVDFVADCRNDDDDDDDDDIGMRMKEGEERAVKAFAMGRTRPMMR